MQKALKEIVKVKIPFTDPQEGLIIICDNKKKKILVMLIVYQIILEFCNLLYEFRIRSIGNV
jgi:hypothetical protein